METSVDTNTIAFLNTGPQTPLSIAVDSAKMMVNKNPDIYYTGNFDGELEENALKKMLETPAELQIVGIYPYKGEDIQAKLMTGTLEGVDFTNINVHEEYVNHSDLFHHEFWKDGKLDSLKFRYKIHTHLSFQGRVKLPEDVIKLPSGSDLTTSLNTEYDLIVSEFGVTRILPLKKTVAELLETLPDNIKRLIGDENNSDHVYQIMGHMFWGDILFEYYNYKNHKTTKPKDYSSMYRGFIDNIELTKKTMIQFFDTKVRIYPWGSPDLAKLISEINEK